MYSFLVLPFMCLFLIFSFTFCPFLLVFTPFLAIARCYVSHERQLEANSWNCFSGPVIQLDISTVPTAGVCCLICGRLSQCVSFFFVCVSAGKRRQERTIIEILSGRSLH